jgi:hypothetical protein
MTNLPESDMSHIIAFLLVTLALGGLLALFGVHVPFPVGWIGAFGLIGWAVVARRRWDHQQMRDGGEPGAPERRVWQRLAGVSVLVGHLGVVLLNPQVDLHFGSGNWLAVDGWCLFFGSCIAAMLLRVDAAERDERDDRIDMNATRTAYLALIVQVLILLLWLAYAPRPLQSGLSSWVIANLLFGSLMVADLAGQCGRLIQYVRDRGA